VLDTTGAAALLAAASDAARAGVPLVSFGLAAADVKHLLAAADAGAAATGREDLAVAQPTALSRAAEAAAAVGGAIAGPLLLLPSWRAAEAVAAEACAAALLLRLDGGGLGGSSDGSGAGGLSHGAGRRAVGEAQEPLLAATADAEAAAEEPSASPAGGGGKAPVRGVPLSAPSARAVSSRRGAGVQLATVPTPRSLLRAQAEEATEDCRRGGLAAAVVRPVRAASRGLAEAWREALPLLAGTAPLLAASPHHAAP